ncbi:unnamed protein product [Arabis nemorensis]|uniref:Uncharacterized protein n=1 Tax=Arabis nemorensis TaxID=586526 RepID=A0A565CDW0_9BRAS|nr:unnamed protein product [Arabis nemorensis]
MEVRPTGKNMLWKFCRRAEYNGGSGKFGREWIFPRLVLNSGVRDSRVYVYYVKCKVRGRTKENGLSPVLW